MRNLVLYDKNFNITEELSKRLALILDESLCTDINTFNEDMSKIDHVIFGIVFNKRLQIARFIQFINEYSEYLYDKKIIIVVYSKENRRQFKDLKILKEKLGESIEMIQSVAYSKEAIVSLGIMLKEKINSYKRMESSEDLLSDIEDFLEDKDGGILATGHSKNIRATPVEVMYHNNFFYIFGRSGEKFANLILDNYVSLSIIEDINYYLQLSGKGFLVPEFVEEYKEVLEKKVLKDESFKEKARFYNLLKIVPFKIELTDSTYEEEGYNIKQIYY